MKVNLILGLVLLSFSNLAFSQKQLPVIKANSITVDIKEDNNLMKGVWRIVPEEKPDIHLTSSKEVTFYTDIDSISFKIKPNEVYDFIILLNGKDSAYTQIKYQPSRLDMLKEAEKYNYNDTRFIPKFTYQSLNDSNLVRIRRDFKLDSIAGEGNEVSQILNLMHWVHTVVQHDGNTYNPEPRNTENLIKVCREENRGVNCRMMATILNECYLAMGIKSRFITCMPKETEFDDCHVINMVYSNDLEKWIWIDPTFDAYIMNEKGELLGIEEVRERLIQGKPLILNPDANWNRKESQTKAYYLEQYMAKNLYRLQTTLVSEYNSERSKSGEVYTYVELLPLDGIEQEPQKEEIENKEKGTKWIYYKTNNPKLFWAKPE
ncbi:MAG: transglutaminase-like domain-containing protein [Prevotellaceae bacterium]|jgi:hypothetical protein|nr:transglutaminase-like domain-containing protein [Prevotellaceae bacterium]